MRTVAASLAVSLAFLFSGCSTGNVSSLLSTPATPAAQGVQGKVHGGQQPVAGASIQLYAVGTTGDGSAATPLVSSTVTTSDGTGTLDSNANAGNANNTLPVGDFTFPGGSYVCPPARRPVVYLVRDRSGSTRGWTLGTDNTAIVMMPLRRARLRLARVLLTLHLRRRGHYGRLSSRRPVPIYDLCHQPGLQLGDAAAFMPPHSPRSPSTRTPRLATLPVPACLAVTTPPAPRSTPWGTSWPRASTPAEASRETGRPAATCST